MDKKARPGRNLFTGEQVEVKARRTIRIQIRPKRRQQIQQRDETPLRQSDGPLI
ncbi:HU family DNA-binding protein [Hydrogenophaga taeniospiralis]|uniref:HU family DNA-binding protein n=1 Tax=Hydrogenophaga taeniospiralis TaxID=65656 RepID=UPI0039B0A078